MKKSLLLLTLLLTLVSCGDDKDEPQIDFQTMTTQFLKGKAFQNMKDATEFAVFTNSQKYIHFYVIEKDKRLWLYFEWNFVVKDVDKWDETLQKTISKTCLVIDRVSEDGQNLSASNPIWLDWYDQWQNYTYTQICIEKDLGYAGIKTDTYKYVGTADEILAKYSSYTKD